MAATNETTRETAYVYGEDGERHECPDCERPSPFGERCAECREAFAADVEALNSDLRDI